MRGLGTLGVLSILCMLMLSPLSGVVSADDALMLSPRAAAPTVPGAPFLPSAARTDLVMLRLDVLTQLDDLRAAEAALVERLEGKQPFSRSLGDGVAAMTLPSPGTTRTARILESRIAALERELSALEISLTPLVSETEEFGVDVSVFPVASLRKPFFNDWGRPRSGGRTHKGNDMLAQTGVELRAIEDGYVDKTSNGSLGGLSIYLIGESGARYYYAHLDEVADLAEGERVYAGQAVGTVGDSGNARGAPHLHMQWAPTGDSNWQNPFFLLDVLFGEGAAAEALAAVDEAPSLERSELELRDATGG